MGEGTESTPAQSPPLSQDPALPLLPEVYKRFSTPSSVFSAGCTNSPPSPLEGAPVGFRVTILSQQLSPSGSGVCCSQPPCSGWGKHAPCYTGSQWSPRMPASQESGFSVILQRSRSLKFSVPSHSSAPSISHKSVLGKTVPCKALSAPSLYPFRPHGCFLSQPVWLLLQISWWTWTLLLQPALILNAQPRTFYVTLYLAPPMRCHFFQFPHIFYLLSAVIFSQGKRFL